MFTKRSYTEKIKSKYLNKLSLELIRRGISNNQIKTTLDEVSTSLDSFISEKDLKSFEEIEQSFGSVKLFCENNMLHYSKEASFGQLAYSLLISLGFLVIISIGISCFFFYPYNLILKGGTEILYGVSITNSGNGIIGTLFGLNMVTWIIYQLLKNQFSRYDIRDNVKTVFLALYWLLFLLWGILFVLPYAFFSNVITDMLRQGMIMPVVEGIIRWVFLGAFLFTTAFFYTKKCKENFQKNRQEKSKTYLIDDLKVAFIFFVLTAFVIPNPGLGMVVLIIGIIMLLLGNVTGETWIIGSLGILTQIAVLFMRLEMRVGHIHTTQPQIIYGMKLEFNRLLGKGNFYFIILSFIILTIWTILCIMRLRKNKRRILPAFRIPNKRKLIQSFLILVVIGLATLGSQPQYTTMSSYHDYYYIPPDTFDNILVLDSIYEIPSEGTVYFSIYTYIEINDSGSHSSILEGNWSIHLDSTISHSGTFGALTSYSYDFDNGVISVYYMEIEVSKSDILEIHAEVNISTTMVFPYSNVEFTPKIPWFPSWIEIVIVTLTVLIIFLTWEEPLTKKNKKLKEHA